MTRLTIIPNVEKKRLTFDGKIASGEHVELRVFDFADKIEEGRLRVRAVDFQGNTLAVFPVKERDENGDVKKDENGNDVWEQWGRDEDYEYATCVFNINTIPALKYFRRGGECLIVLDDPESKTLYGSGHLCVLPWPKEIGKDEPVDLDSYPDNIKDFVRRLDDAEDKVENCRRNVESALSFASNANTNANTAVTTAQNAMSASSDAKTSAANALADSAAAKKAAQDAEGLVAAAQNAAQDAKNSVAGLAEVARSGSYNDLSDKPQIPSIEGLAKETDVDHVENVLRGELNGEISRAKAAEKALGASVEAKAEATALTSERQRAEAAEASIRKDLEGKASLDGRGKVPASQLPSYVDDVMEFASKSRFPRPGEGGKIYIATDTNKQYRWSGTKYAEISSSLALGETAQTAYPGDKGAKNAADIARLKAEKQGLIVGEQLDALNSGATKKKIDSIENKQDKLNDEEKSVLARGPYIPVSGGNVYGKLALIVKKFVDGDSGYPFEYDPESGRYVSDGGDELWFEDGKWYFSTDNGEHVASTDGEEDDDVVTFSIFGISFVYQEETLEFATLSDAQKAVLDGGPYATDGAVDSKVESAKTELNARIDLIEATSRPNMNIVGSPKFSKGVVSGFSANDYLMFPTQVDVGQNSVDFYMGFTTVADVSAQQNILDSWCGLALAIQNGNLILAVSSNGTSFETSTSLKQLSASSSYHLRLSFDYNLSNPSRYTVRAYIDDDLSSWCEVVMTAPFHPTATYWGGANPQSGVHHIFGGTINLNECRMEWNGNVVWRGYDELPTVKFDPTAAPRLDTAEKIVAHIMAQFDNGETEEF